MKGALLVESIGYRRDLKEVGGSLRPDALMHVHLAAALADDAHNAWVRDSALYCQRPAVQLLQPLCVLQLCVHLYFQCIHFQQLCALLQIILAVLSLARPVMKHHGQTY